MPLESAIVREELSRVLRSPGFAKSPRLSQFLTFIVETTLSGHPESIKESTIGVEVFERQAGYDPKAEPVVRVQARRLRERLQNYYSAEPRSPVMIALPKGAYIPRFELRQPQLNVEPDHRRRRLVSRWVGAVTILVAAAVSAAKWTGANSQGREPRPLTSLPGRELNPAWSPDGKQIAFTWSGEQDRTEAIYLQAVEGGEPKRLSQGSFGERRPVWSPNGETIAFLRGAGSFRSSIVLHDLRRHSERAIATIQHFLFLGAAPGMAWAPNGKWLAVSDQPSATRPARLIRVDVDSGHQTVLTNPPVASSGDIDVRISPDGTQIAFQRGQLGELYALDLTGRHSSREVRLGQLTQGLNGFDWIDNQTIVFASGQGAQGTVLWRTATDGGEAQPVEIALQNVHTPAFDRVRKRLAVVTQQRDVNIWRLRLPSKPAPPGLGITPVLTSTRLDTHVAVSPRSGRLAFISARGGTGELWIAEPDGSRTQQITHFAGEGSVSMPSWSPDEIDIVFHARVRGNSDIYAVRNDGSSLRQLTHEPSRELKPSYSHDGRSLYFTSDRTGEFQVFQMDLASRAVTQVTQAGAVSGVESVNGRDLILFRLEPQPQFCRKALPDGPEEVLTSIDSEIAVFGWTLGRRHLYFLADSFYRLNLKTRMIEKLAEARRLPSAAESALAVTPDESSLLFTRLDLDSSDLMVIDKPFR